MANAHTLGETVTAATRTPAPVASESNVAVPAAPPIPRAEVRPEIVKATAPVAAVQDEASDAVDGAWPLAGIGRRFVALVLDLASGVLLGGIGAFGLLAVLVWTGGVASGDDPRSLMFFIVVGIVLLYLAFGWSKGETLGMLLTRTRLLRRDDGKPAGVPRAFLRAIGFFITIILGLIVFAIITVINENLPFIQGYADLAVRVGAVLVGLYVIWLGTGQMIIGGTGRQTLADRIGGTIVAIRQ